MSTRASRRSLTAADLKDQLHDIQDNVVAPILMRYGRHIFVKFTDGAKARAWLRNMFDRVNARQEEHGTRFTVNIGFTYEGLKAIGLSRPSLESFPEAFRVGMRGRAQRRGRCRTARAGALGGRPRRSRHPRDGLASHRFRPGPRRGDADLSRRDGGDRRCRDPLRAGHDGARARKRDRVGRRAFRICRSDLAAADRGRGRAFVSRRRRAAAGWHVASAEAGRVPAGL